MLLVAMMCTFCGCQPAPEKESVISKENQFEDKLSETSPDVQINNELTEITFSDHFSSTDGSVNYDMDIKAELPSGDASVVDVMPHYLTAEDMKSVAFALFPDGEFYEAEPDTEICYSKKEIQDKLNRWSQYTNIDALKTLYGDSASEEMLRRTSGVVKNFIEKYTQLYETAPENTPSKPCDWVMKKTDQYILSEEFRQNADPEKSNDGIFARVQVDGIPYLYTAATRNKSDFKVNMISAFIHDGIGPENVDKFHFRANLCSNTPPTEEQLNSAKEKAQAILDQANLGKWKIDYVKENRNYQRGTKDYSILIGATPELGSVSVIRWPQLGSLKDENGYAPSQYLTDATFEYSPDGTLMKFDLRTPLEISEGKVGTVIEPDQIMQRAKDYFTLTDFAMYSEAYSSMEWKCNVKISKVEYGLSRMPQKDKEGYYYVPSVVFSGTVTFENKKTGEVTVATDELQTLLVLNAIDATIIPLA